MCEAVERIVRRLTASRRVAVVPVAVAAVAIPAPAGAGQPITSYPGRSRRAAR